MLTVVYSVRVRQLSGYLNAAWLTNNTRKCTSGHVRPAKTQICLRSFVLSDQTSLVYAIQQALCEDTDQTARMHILLLVIAGRIYGHWAHISVSTFFLDEDLL